MKKPLREQIAKRLAEVLDEKGWKQQDLVNASGLTKAYVSLIMHGTLNLTLDTIETLEKAFVTAFFKSLRERLFLRIGMSRSNGV